MSLPALLSHFGIDKARYVTGDGQIIFDGVTKAEGAFRHSVHGMVTPVAAHTFHGGEEDADHADGSEPPWWSSSPGELERHVQAMSLSFPGFIYLPSEDGDAPAWVGTIDTGRGSFKIGVVTRRDGGLPRVIVLDKQLGAPAGRRWEMPPHLYRNGNLCVADASDWNPGVHTVATVTAWAAHWLAAYTEWRIRRRWPVEGSHAVAS